MRKKYQFVLNDLKEKIITHTLINNQTLPSESQLAEYYKVSRSTIQDVLASLQKKGYITKTKGKKSTVNTSFPFEYVGKPFISIIITDTNSLIIDMVNAIEEIISDEYSIRLYITNGDTEKERNICQKIIKEGCKGLILFALSDSANIDFYTDLVLSDFPIIFVDKTPAYAPTNVIKSNGFKGVYDLTEYAINCGHNNLAFYSSTKFQTIQDRLRGFYSALYKHKIKIPKENVIISNSVNPLVEMLISKKITPTCIICGKDDDAFKLIQQLKKRGIEVPQDISVTGFDNVLPTSANFLLTTAKQNFIELGRVATQKLLNEIRSPNNVKTTTYINCDIILRNSVKILKNPSKWEKQNDTTKKQDLIS